MMDAPIQSADLAIVANLIFALSSLIAAITGVISVVQGRSLDKKAAKNTLISESNNQAIGVVASQVSVVDVKMDAVSEQTNGHMTSLIAAVAPVNPALATAAAVKIVETAERVADQLKETADKAAKGK